MKWTKKPMTWGGYALYQIIVWVASMAISFGYIAYALGLHRVIADKFADLKNRIFKRD